MKTIKIVIERSKDAFWGYAENVDGVNGVGNTVAEVKASVLEGVEIVKTFGKQTPAILKGDYVVEYHYDLESFLSYYKGIFNNAALERITGINQKQLHHYATGLKKPRQAQRQKIENGLHSLAKELLTVHL